MNKQLNGFTLIELIAIITILGLLAVVAAPRFLDLSTDARKAVLESLEASIEQAAKGAYLKAALAGAQNNARSSPSNPPQVEINGQIMELKYGYPEAYAETTANGDILSLLQLDDDLEICYSDSCVSGNSSRVKIGFDTTEDTGCYVRYSEPGGTGAVSATQYGLLIVDAGC